MSPDTPRNIISPGAPGEIITFYSYKGGVGRSMALSNVACLLAKRKAGNKVLMTDWDLEAPGLHKFFYDKFRVSDRAEELDGKLGLIDIFIKLDAIIPKSRPTSEEEIENIAYKALESIELEQFIVEIPDIPNLGLLKAGRFDDDYSNRVNNFKWEKLYNRSPLLFRLFAERLAEQYRYVLIDSRTGYTDISGICTMLMPQKLVLVFTPNRQSYTGIEDMIRRATTYRRQSDDLRPLLVFPLPSRIESSRDDLRAIWRKGDTNKDIEGYQPMFEKIFNEVYGLNECNLEDYFEEVQIQQSPNYAYGEEIAVEVEKTFDRFSLSQSYNAFTEWLVNSAAPWQRIKEYKIGDIFLSYASSDRKKAEFFVEALERQNFSVWDRSVLSGATFDKATEKALEDAKCMIVLWSKESVKSWRVLAEAGVGSNRGILVPVLIDDVKIPLDFRRLQATRLIDWQGTSPDPAFSLIIESVAKILGRPTTAKKEQIKFARERIEREKGALINLLREGKVEEFNKFRSDNPEVKVDFSGLDLSEIHLSEINLSLAYLSKVKLRKANLSNADFALAKLTESDLSWADLSKSDLSGADLSEANLSEAKLSDAILIEANFSNTNLSGADLFKVNLSKANFSGADLSEANLSEADFSSADLSKANLSKANLSGANLSKANFSKANLSRANLSEADFSGADLSEANISGAEITGIKLTNTNLILANLSGADLSQTDLSTTYLTQADLSGANLIGAKLYGKDLSYAKLLKANLTDAHLSFADLKEADLSIANLSNADLSDTNLTGSNLSNADLSGTFHFRTNLVQANLTGAKFIGARLYQTNLSGANLTEADLSELNLSGATFIRFVGTNLSKVKLAGANLSDLYCLSKVKLVESDLSKAKISWSNLSESDLSKAKLTYADLRGADLRGAKLIGADLVGADLRSAKLVGTDLKGADLRGANLSGIVRLIETTTEGVKVNNETKAERIMLVKEEDSNDIDKIKEALEAINNDLREIILRDNDYLKEIFNQTSISIPIRENLSKASILKDLLNQLLSSDVIIRTQALQDFKKIPDFYYSDKQRLLNVVILKLKSGNDDERWYAAYALGELGYVKAVNPLIEALKDKSDYVRWVAVEALGKLGDWKAVDPLIVVLKDEDKYVRRTSAEVIGKLSINCPHARAVDPLIEILLNDKDKKMRGIAAEALGKRHDEGVVDPLIEALKDKSAEVRKTVAKVLGKLGDERAVNPLIEALEDESKYVLMAVAYALGELGNVRAVDPLKKLSNHKDEDVRKTVAGSLKKLMPGKINEKEHGRDF